jgi:glucose-6-phosphate 1-epimerase
MSEPRLTITSALPSSIRLVGGDDTLPAVEVATRLAAARVHFHGAHVTRWQPSHAAAPVLWLSKHSFFQRDKPIRGGVPICFPWFGPHPSDPRAPAHGFARISEWTLVEAQESSAGTLLLGFSLDQRDLPLPPREQYGFHATYRVILGAELTMTLEIENTGADLFRFEDALHTYFTVGDIERVAIAGLESTDYLDKTAGSERRTQPDEPVRFSSETDRIYVETSAVCVVHDPVLQRRIVVSKDGSRSTVVWNPWIDKARAMPDFGDDEWRGMVCVETANVGDAAVRLEPGQTHTMSATVSVP